VSKQDSNWEEEHKDHNGAPARFLLLLLQEMGAREGEKAHPPCTAQQTPPTMAWVCAHLLRRQLSCNNSSGTATRLRARSFNKWSSCTSRACMWERMGTCIFKRKNSHQLQFWTRAVWSSREGEKMCWFPLELDHLLQTGQLIWEELWKMWSIEVHNFRVVLVLGWPVRGPVPGQVFCASWTSNRL